jgi:hypothetical protein
MRRQVIAAFAIALIAACASPRSAQRAPDAVLIRLSLRPPATCLASLGGQDFELPSNNAPFSAALRSRARASANARIDGGVEIPYKCFGNAVWLAQRAGFKRVAFTAERPPLPGR